MNSYGAQKLGYNPDDSFAQLTETASDVIMDTQRTGKDKKYKAGIYVQKSLDYLKNLAKIAKINKLQCLVATHSPQIFDSMWNLTFDLYDIMHPRIEE